MSKRLGAAFVAGTALATVFTVGNTTPAAAASPCGVYPAGQSFTLARAPYSGEVAKGAAVGTRGTLRRGGQACVGYTLALYVHTPGATVYKYAGRGVTNSTGSVRVTVTVDVTKRFFYNLNLGNGQSVRSGISQLVAV